MLWPLKIEKVGDYQFLQIATMANSRPISYHHVRNNNLVCSTFTVVTCIKPPVGSKMLIVHIHIMHNGLTIIYNTYGSQYIVSHTFMILICNLHLLACMASTCHLINRVASVLYRGLLIV